MSVHVPELTPWSLSISKYTTIQQHFDTIDTHILLKEKELDSNRKQIAYSQLWWDISLKLEHTKYINENPNATYHQYKQHFIEKFKDKQAQTAARLKLKSIQLYNTKSRYTDVVNYNITFDRLTIQADDIDAKTLAEYYVDGLMGKYNVHSDLYTYVRSQLNTSDEFTLDNAKKYALAHAATLDMLEQSTRAPFHRRGGRGGRGGRQDGYYNSSVYNVEYQTPNYEPSQVEQHNVAVHNVTNQPIGGNGTAPQQAQPQHQQQPYYTAQYRGNSNRGRGSGRGGHIQHTQQPYPYNGQRRYNPNIQCYNCRGFGHIAINCTYPKNGLRQ